MPQKTRAFTYFAAFAANTILADLENSYVYDSAKYAKTRRLGINAKVVCLNLCKAQRKSKSEIY